MTASTSIRAAMPMATAAGVSRTGSAFWRRFRTTKLYDLLAATPLVMLYAFCVAQQLPRMMDKIGAAKLADINFPYIIATLAELASLVLVTSILIFVLLRMPAKRRARGLIPAIVAIGGTSFAVIVVFLPPFNMGLMLSMVSLLMIGFGLSFAAYTMMYLGRSFAIMPAARKLVTSGPYSLIRHPLYLGEGMAIVGMMLQYLSPLAVVIVGLQIAFQVQRMKNEEAVLSAEYPEYADYMQRTARLIPGVY
ncbi:MAG: methyltransferase family protein [Alphaproteobacteria bacterium]